MPGSAMAELIFIAAMMILILVISFAAVYFFFKTYRKEMAEKKAKGSAAERRPEKANEIQANGGSNGTP
jgi:uncharacterized protein YpmB